MTDRRRILGALAATAGCAMWPAGAAAAPRKVAIVGAGMAGVACAWLLDGSAEVKLFEAGSAIGGNVRSVPFTVDGVDYMVDLGAQFFHPAPYPNYVQLLEQLGLYPAAPGGTRSFTTSITVFAADETNPRFVSPLIPGRVWPLAAPWNQAGVQAFAAALPAARRRERQDASYDLTLGDWLPTLGLTQPQWEGILLPWVASLFSGDVEQARDYSARAAMVFAAKTLPLNPLEPIVYNVLEPGMIEPLLRLVAQFTAGTQVFTGTAVSAVERAGGGFVVHAGGASHAVDDVVFASSGPPTAALLAGVADSTAQQAALAGIEFADARLMLHTDAAYARSEARLRSFLNSEVSGAFCDASMRMAPVLAVPSGKAPPSLWKSWVTHRSALPQQVLHDVSYRHLVPTPASIQAQQQLRALSGAGGLWFAGGYLHPYDSQETALVSAMDVAAGIVPNAARLRRFRRA
jgi:uncharacterized protein